MVKKFWRKLENTQAGHYIFHKINKKYVEIDLLLEFKSEMT